MQSIDNVLKLRKGLKPDDPNPDIFDILWAKKLSGTARDYTVTGNPLSFLAKKAQTAKSTKISMTPVQDLHGYEYPWPAGGGKNIIPYPYYTADGAYGGIPFSTDSDGKITASGTTNAADNFYLIRFGTLKAGTYTLSIKGNHSGLKLRFYDRTNEQTLVDIQPSTSDSYATITTTSDLTVHLFFNIPTSDITVNISAYVQLESGSTATSYTPYSNICPISGRSSVEIKGCGKNRLNYDDISLIQVLQQEEQERRYGFVIDKPGTYTISGITGLSSNSYLIVKKVSASGIYGTAAYVCVPSAATVENPCTRTIADGEKLLCYTLISDDKQTAITIFNNMKAQLELGSSATEYEPYAESNDVTITFGETVYGGTLDVETGVLTVDKASIDLGLLNYTYSTNYQVFTSNGNIENMKYVQGNNSIISSSYKTSPIQSAVAPDFSIYTRETTSQTQTNRGIGIKDSRYSDADVFKTAVTGQTACYSLETPRTITLTPEQIQILKGQNTIWIEDEGAVIALTYKN